MQIIAAKKFVFVILPLTKFKKYLVSFTELVLLMREHFASAFSWNSSIIFCHGLNSW